MATFALVHGGWHGLDADLIELPGSHSPFLSRPQALADALIRIAGDKS